MRKKAKKIKYKGPTLMDRLPNNQGEWLMLAIKNTQKTLGGHAEKSYDYLEDQLERLQGQLKEWKLANPKEKLREL